MRGLLIFHWLVYKFLDHTIKRKKKSRNVVKEEVWEGRRDLLVRILKGILIYRNFPCQ